MAYIHAIAAGHLEWTLYVISHVERNPRVTITIWDREDPYRFVEVRGEVVGK